MAYCPKYGYKWQLVKEPKQVEFDDLLPCLPLSIQIVRLKIKNMGPGQPRGNFEVLV